MHKLAIVVPYYKADHFGETLKSLWLQTNKNFSLYIGNDASPVDPMPIISRYFKPEEYTYFAYQDNLGSKNLAFQWQRILKNVTEEWFQLLGDDDFISLNFVEKFYKNIGHLDSSINVIKVKSVLCDGSGHLTKQLYERYPTSRYHVVDFMIDKFAGRLNSSLSEHIFRRNKFEAVGFVPYPLSWHTDDRVILEVSNFKTFYFIAEAKVFVRIYDGSTSGAKDNLPLKRDASIQFFNDVSDLLEKRNISWYRKRKFLKSLRNNKDVLGGENLKKIYYKHGVAGMLYYRTYTLKLLFKQLLPKKLIGKIQKSATYD